MSRDYHSSDRDVRGTRLQMFFSFPAEAPQQKRAKATMHPAGMGGGKLDPPVGRESHASESSEASFHEYFTLVKQY